VTRKRALDELVTAGIDSRMLDVWTAIPGKVASYDSSVPSANVQPLVRRMTPDEDDASAFEDLPEIPNVPILFLGAGAFRITFPIAPGDSGLLIVCTNDLSAWLATGQPSDPGDLAVHHLAHAVFLPGLVPFSSPIPEAAENAIVVAGAEIRLGSLAASDFVALSSKVDANFTAIATSLSTAVNASLNPVATYTPQAVAATKVKAE
jgi:hypothetical protein